MSEFTKLSGEITLGTWNFKVIDLKDKDIYTEYIKKTQYAANLWTSNFALLWAISQSPIRKVLWKIVDNMLVTFGYLKSGFLYLICLPFGEGDADKVVDIVHQSLKYCADWNKEKSSLGIVKVINRLQLEFLQSSKNFENYFQAIGLVGKEKHFSISKLITLSGKEFETIRRKINKFRRLCPDTLVREYNENDYEQVMALDEIWRNTAGVKYAYIFDEIYFKNLTKYYKELDHLILVVESKGTLIGMVSGGELPTGQSWWCISKFVNYYDGISEFLVVELAKEINRRNSEVELMNAAEDLGPGGLRFFKERFRPVLDLERYLLKLK
ncbi:phosphatidylglycerol lysyltransferase domain-containing protein [Clostridium thermarum]|uniref:phosphatidylglycerol lysyltransferase domain-containing protein n=1 Tax=Clostridium thermarum TaxID=1716543 RepID=UPI0011240989|nr:phosphatidylglycerol lysyltransferase domain-containing protein [Clostridium thermarum]